MVEVNLLTGALKVRLEKAPDSPPVAMHRNDVKLIRDGKGGRAAEQPEETEEPQE